MASAVDSASVDVKVTKRVTLVFLFACRRHACRVGGVLQRALAHRTAARLTAQPAPVFIYLDAPPVLEDDWAAKIAVMALPSKKNSAVPIGTPADTGVSAISE